MKRTLLISVAAVALAAGSTVALSQGSGGAGGGAGGNTPMANPSAPSGGQDTKGAQERTAPSTQQKSTQSPSSGEGTTNRQTQGEQPTKSQQQTQSPSSGGSKQGASEQTTPGTKSGQQGAGNRGTASSNVSLTNEQKTTIRSTVLSSGPKVTKVNFNVRVGTVIPRTVKIAPLPATLIEIQPAWRGYMYFVYSDEIIVVEPGSLRIVAVLEV